MYEPPVLINLSFNFLSTVRTGHLFSLDNSSNIWSVCLNPSGALTDSDFLSNRSNKSPLLCFDNDNNSCLTFSNNRYFGFPTTLLIAISMFSSASTNAAHPQASIRTHSKLIHPTIVPWPIRRHLEPTLLDSVILLPTLAQIGSLREIFETLPFFVTVPTEVAVAELIINISFIDKGLTVS